MMDVASQKRIFVMVEGVSDVAFLSLYLKKIYGFDFVPGSHKSDERYSSDEYKRKVRCEPTSLVANNEYDEFITIVSCDGHTSFDDAFDKYIAFHFKNAPSGSRLRLIILEDADEKGLSSNTHCPDLKYCNEDAFLDDSTDWNKGVSNFGTAYEYKATKHLIPYEGTGCLETVLLDSIRGSEPNLIDESERFVDGLSKEASAHIAKRRKRIKAKMGVVFALLNPEGTFKELVEKFALIDCKNDAITKQFKVFTFLKN